MNRQEAREAGRKLYATYGTLTRVDTLKVGPEGGLTSGIPVAEADGWAVFAWGTSRILFPGEYRGKEARTRPEDIGEVHAVCWRCDQSAGNPRDSRHADCECTTHCGSRFCGVRAFEPPEDSWA